MALEKEDLVLLAKPLPVEAHEFLNGLVYLTEEPITERLDEVDPGWQFVIKSITTRANAGDGGKDVATVTVHASLIIKGVARDGVGMAIVQRTNPIQAKNKAGQVIGEYTSEANEAEKSAATDAFKRAARMFGIGRYILGMGKSVQNEQQLRQWLQKNYPAQQSKPAPASTGKLAPEAHGLSDTVLTTPEIRVVDIKKSDTGKIYIVAGGITFFSRDPFRALGFPKEFIDKMEVIKNGLYLPVPIRIAYTEITVGNQKQRTPISVMRTDTELEVEVKARQTA